MSFNSYRKPRLVEPKLSKYYIDKIKKKELNAKNYIYFINSYFSFLVYY